MNLEIPCIITTPGTYKCDRPIVHNTLGPFIDIQCDGDVEIIFDTLTLNLPVDYANVDCVQMGIFSGEQNNLRNLKIIGNLIVKNYSEYTENLKIFGISIAKCENLYINLKEQQGFDPRFTLEGATNVEILNCDLGRIKFIDCENVKIKNSNIDGKYYDEVAF